MECNELDADLEKDADSFLCVYMHFHESVKINSLKSLTSIHFYASLCISMHFYEPIKIS